MSSDFWWGMFAIPIAAVAVGIVSAAAIALIHYSERFNFPDWKIWPKRVQKYNRGSIASTVASAKWVRYFWVPGWHIVFCRTTLVRPGDSLSQHRQLSEIIDRFLMDYADGDRISK